MAAGEPGVAAEAVTSQPVGGPEFSGAVQMGTDALKAFAEAAGKVASALGGVISRQAEAGAQMMRSADYTEESAQKMGMLTVALMGTKEKYAEMDNAIGASKGASDANSQFTRFKGIIENSTGGIKQLQQIASTIKFPNIGGLASMGVGQAKQAILDFASNVMIAKDNSQRMAQVVMEGAQNMGRLDEILGDSFGGNVDEQLNSVQKVSAAVFSQLEGQFATSQTNIESWVQTLVSAPGMLDSFVQAGGGAEGVVNQISQAIKVGMGLNMDYSTMQQKLISQYDKFGISGMDAIKVIAGTSQVANQLKIPLKDATTATEGLQQAFGKMGIATRGGTEGFQAINRMAANQISALRAAGATPEKAASLAEKALDVTSLTTAQKAMLSARSGGPSGLLGAAKIDQLLMSGKPEDMAKVQEMMMKQVQSRLPGGKAMDISDVKTPADAALLQRQQMILKSGPFASVFGQMTDTDLKLMLSATRRQQMGTAPKVEMPSDYAEKILERGEAKQRAGTTVFGKMEAEQRAFRTALEPGVADIVTETIGVSPVARRDLSQVSPTDRQRIAEGRQSSVQEAATAAAMTEGTLPMTPEMAAAAALEREARITQTVVAPAKPKLAGEVAQTVGREISAARAGKAAPLAPEAARAATTAAAGSAAVTGERPGAAAAAARAAAPVVRPPPIEFSVSAICLHCKTILENEHSQVVAPGAAVGKRR